MPERHGGASATSTARPLAKRLFDRLRDGLTLRAVSTGQRVNGADAPTRNGPGRDIAQRGLPDGPTSPRLATDPTSMPRMAVDPPPPTPGAGADLAVCVLGGTDVWVRGRRVERWSSRRGQMVFRYVLWQRRPVRREALMDLLWPHATPQSARNNLNVAIYGLRRTLEVGGPGPYVVHRAGSYQLAPDLTVWCDADAFESHRHRAQIATAEVRDTDAERHLSRAAELYGGPLFADATDGEWYLDPRRTLTEHYVDVLEHRARVRHEAGDFDHCIELCRQVLGVEPCHEAAHRLLMRSYAARGLHHLVARQYTDCVHALRNRLDVPPHPDTTSMFHALVDIS